MHWRTEFVCDLNVVRGCVVPQPLFTFIDIATRVRITLVCRLLGQLGPEHFVNRASMVAGWLGQISKLES